VDVLGALFVPGALVGKHCIKSCLLYTKFEERYLFNRLIMNKSEQIKKSYFTITFGFNFCCNMILKLKIKLN
jgi:hypothetical protein